MGTTGKNGLKRPQSLFLKYFPGICIFWKEKDNYYLESERELAI